MNKSPWIKLWVSDIVASCSDMSAETFGIHMRMILYSWDRGYCPSDPKKLKSITNFKHFRSLSEAVTRWKAVRIPSVSEVVLIHPRVEEERQKMLESSQKMTERSQKANEVRWKKPVLVGSHGGILNYQYSINYSKYNSKGIDYSTCGERKIFKKTSNQIRPHFLVS